MAENKYYVAIGEEAARGTPESGSVFFLPVNNPSIPKMEYEDKVREDFRGEDTMLGDTVVRRMGEKWSHSFEIPFFTEAGAIPAGIGTILKHFFGKAVSAQNGATGQYGHMFYPVADPFSASNLGDKALTIHSNFTAGGTLRNIANSGGRISALNFTQEVGQQLMLGVEMFGQSQASVPIIPSPSFPAENLRCDFHSMTSYMGTITRVGTAPDFTDITPGSAASFIPDKISLKIENGRTDKMQLSGQKYPTKTMAGKYKFSLEFTLDFDDPASGFSSYDEFIAYRAGVSTTDFFLHWDTGTQAGTGDNHSLGIDLPKCVRQHGDSPAYEREKEPSITLKYDGLLDQVTTGYLIGMMLKTSAAAV